MYWGCFTLLSCFKQEQFLKAQAKKVCMDLCETFHFPWLNCLIHSSTELIRANLAAQPLGHSFTIFFFCLNLFPLFSPSISLLFSISNHGLLLPFLHLAFLSLNFIFPHFSVEVSLDFSESFMTSCTHNYPQYVIVHVNVFASKHHRHLCLKGI